MKKIIVMLAVCGLAAGAHAADGDQAFLARLKADFRARGIDGMDRLDQDKVQALCSNTPHVDELPREQVRALEQEQLETIRYPADNKFLGDWKKGEALAQDGRGMTWSDKAGAPAGGNCYNCHQLAPSEVSFGTLGPSLRHYGRIHGNTAESQLYTWSKIYNAKAFNMCTNMPRFGHKGVLTESQIKDLVALLLDPESPVNK